MAAPTSYSFRGGQLGNFARSTIHLPNVSGEVRAYGTVEHYFQASKALDPAEHEHIRSLATPREAKRAGRRVRLRNDWELVKADVMRRALRAKFEGEPFRSALLATGERLIVEESDRDLEWGARRAANGWEGQNRLGQLLMEVRAELRAQSGAAEVEQLALPL